VLNAARACVIASLYHDSNIPIIVITTQPEAVKKLYSELQAWCLPSTNLHSFPELEFSPYEYNSYYSNNTTRERLSALSALTLYNQTKTHSHDNHLSLQTLKPSTIIQQIQNKTYHEHKSCTSSIVTPDKHPPLIISSVLSIISKTVAQEDFNSFCHTLKPGLRINPSDLLIKWQDMGYEMEDSVMEPGEMSRRGGIIDIYPVCSEFPVRIEFIGNQIESLREFNPDSQCSTSIISSLLISPAKEAILSRIANKINPSALELEGCLPEFKQRIENDFAKLKQKQWFPHAAFYFPLFNHGNVFHYLPDETIIILDNPSEIQTTVERLNKEAMESRDTKLKEGNLPLNFPSPYFDWNEINTELIRFKKIILQSWHSNENENVTMQFIRPPSYGGNLALFLNTARQLIQQRQRLIIVSQQTKRLSELLQEENIHTSPITQLKKVPPRSSITLLQGSLEQGWSIDKELTILTDAELFGFVKQRRLHKKAVSGQRWLIPQLNPSDYVVHIDHGIARFAGLTRMLTDGKEQEYLILEYAADGKLYLPTYQIGRISQYIGAGGQKPILNRLGTQEWHRTKRRIKESVADLAQELLVLYAAREAVQGFAYSPDVLWQYEMEAAFSYLETPDQADAIAAVKEDMEKMKPMDRLICGDVGYGKTEVALRASFKAVMDNKQVAVLVPTTVLAQQHFQTFSQRLQAFPIQIEMLSRFCSPDKSRKIIEGLAKGNIDICLGTHRLLQNNISFKDLGLVIIDEEQRFGVLQKERLKQMRKEVDVLALSATPIPRTLHMSLTGIKDISIMETAPEERLAIKTYIGTYNETLVRQAILREIERNGQVFYVHNRVQDIAIVADNIKSLIPEAIISIAHGQMPEGKLEKIVADFSAGKSDVLVTTTIIQLGLDMPNTNTLIVDQADRFGLTQLYQLRGRIGRGANQAYAYFLYSKDKELSPQAHKRLRTIYEATELGGGFAIAMKDLEIRGAGNLLGVKQSGHIAAIGFEFYCQMLADAVEEIKSTKYSDTAISVRKSEDIPLPSIALPLTAYISEEYIANLSTRLSLYSRLAQVKSKQEIEHVEQELRDRFGTLPETARNLLYVAKIRILATKAKTISISTHRRYITIRLSDLYKLPENKYQYSNIQLGVTQITLNYKALEHKWMTILEEILQDLSETD
jgi:transcription-repair coupling factor (superfamily II helicase)